MRPGDRVPGGRRGDSEESQVEATLYEVSRVADRAVRCPRQTGAHEELRANERNHGLVEEGDLDARCGETELHVDRTARGRGNIEADEPMSGRSGLALACVVTSLPL